MHYYFKTPLEKANNLSKLLGINLFIKRDDLFPSLEGGNKARKLNYIINNSVKKNYNAIVTAGSVNSNHLRATSLMAARLGWESILLIHDPVPAKIEGNLKIISLTDACLKFINRNDLEEEKRKAIEELKRKGKKPLWIYGGGHCLEGVIAYYDAVIEIKKQLGKIIPEFVIVASGTGTTQAGLIVGFNKFYPNCKVLGVSVSYPAYKGRAIVSETIDRFNNYIKDNGKLKYEIYFDDEFIGKEGYGKSYDDIYKIIKTAAKTEGLILDPIYTGKAFYALTKYVENGFIPLNSNVIFWHTGGLFNLLSDNLIF